MGLASWYGAAFHGRRTANGEVYDMASLTAAHPTMPLPSYARVTNLDNGYSVIVRVNDRGPYHGGRVMDVSSRAADVLGFKGEGTARIKVEYVGQAPLEGSDDNALLASLRTDGSPANLNGYSAPVMVASEGGPEPGPSPFQALFAQARAAPPPAPVPQLEPVRASPRALRLSRAPAPVRETKASPMSLAFRPTGRFRSRRRVPSTSGRSTAASVVAVMSRPNLPWSRPCPRGGRWSRRALRRRSTTPIARPSVSTSPADRFERIKPASGLATEE